MAKHHHFSPDCDLAICFSAAVQPSIPSPELGQSQTSITEPQLLMTGMLVTRWRAVLHLCGAASPSLPRCLPITEEVLVPLHHF